MKRLLFWVFLMTITASLIWAFTPKSIPAADNPVFENDFVVVRAYFTGKQMVADLAAWKEPWQVDYVNNYVVVDVTAVEYQQLLNLGFIVEIDEALTAELNQPRLSLPDQGGGIPGYPCYRTVEETFTAAQAIATQHPTLATWTDIGDSWEKANGLGGYDIMVLRLTNSAISSPKPKLFIMSAIHAREYTTAELNTRFAEYLINNYGSDADATWLLDYNEIHLLLQSNPDGRKQAETGLLWRKNTNQNYCSPTSTNRGADLNRNFQFNWGCCGGSSSNQCAPTYRGPSPASETEVQAVQNYVMSQFPDLREPALGASAPLTTTGIFLDLHSYSELVLWPWGFTNTPTGNDAGLVTLGRKLAYFNGYYPDQAIGLYPTDGTTDDFAYGELGLPAYTFELGTAFFQSCTTFENTILPHNLNALIYAAKAVRAPYLEPAGPEAINPLFNINPIANNSVTTLTVTLDDTRYNHQNGAEPSQNIAAAQYYLDVPPWVTTTTSISGTMTAVDGSFNSPVEVASASIDTTMLSEGSHTVFVRGQDANGQWGVFTAVFLHITNTAPTAAFTATTPVALGHSTIFTNTSTGSNLQFLWDFGDGTTSSALNPNHIYTTTGSYTVTLTASNSLGTDVASDIVQVLLAPSAGFTTSGPTLLGETTIFTSTATGDNLHYLWDFGDGITSSEEDPIHLYMASGSYTVTLTVSNAVGNDTATAVVQVITDQPIPTLLYIPALYNN